MSRWKMTPQALGQGDFELRQHLVSAPESEPPPRNISHAYYSHDRPIRWVSYPYGTLFFFLLGTGM